MKSMIALRVPSDMAKRLVTVAKQKGFTKTDVVISALEKYMGAGSGKASTARKVAAKKPLKKAGKK